MANDKCQFGNYMTSLKKYKFLKLKYVKLKKFKFWGKLYVNFNTENVLLNLANCLEFIFCLKTILFNFVFFFFYRNFLVQFYEKSLNCSFVDFQQKTN